MHTTPAQERFFPKVEQAVLELGGMKTKFHAFPLTLGTAAGVLRVKPVFDGIECQFDHPERAAALFPDISHNLKGTFKVETPLGSHDDAAYDQVIVTFWKTVAPILSRSTATAISTPTKRPEQQSPKQ
jgi:hypothetical protein